MVEGAAAMENGAAAWVGCNRIVFGAEVVVPRPALAPAGAAPRACASGRHRGGGDSAAARAPR